MIVRPNRFSRVAHDLVRGRAPLLWYIVLLLALSAPLAWVAAGRAVLPGDVTISRAVQAAPIPAAADVARLGYWIGATSVTIALGLTLTLLLGIAGRVPEAFLILATTVVRGLNPFLKAAFESPRPSPAWVRVTEDSSGLGFPSSHAMGVVLLFGAVFYLAPRLIRPRGAQLLVRTLAIAAILVTGFGRVYTGAHWPTDVLGGYLWGTILLLAVLGAYRLVRGFLHAEERAGSVVSAAAQRLAPRRRVR